MNSAFQRECCTLSREREGSGCAQKHKQNIYDSVMKHGSRDIEEYQVSVLSSIVWVIEMGEEKGDKGKEKRGKRRDQREGRVMSSFHLHNRLSGNCHLSLIRTDQLINLIN